MKLEKTASAPGRTYAPGGDAVKCFLSEGSTQLFSDGCENASRRGVNITDDHLICQKSCDACSIGRRIRLDAIGFTEMGSSGSLSILTKIPILKRLGSHRG